MRGKAVTPFVLDGFTFNQTTQWAYPYGTRGAGVANSETTPRASTRTATTGCPGAALTTALRSSRARPSARARGVLRDGAWRGAGAAG